MTPKKRERPDFVIWEYLYSVGAPDSPLLDMGIGWAYRIIKTGETKDGFPTEAMARIAAETAFRRIQWK